MKNPPRPIPAADELGIFVTADDGTELFLHSRQPVSAPKAAIHMVAGITGINNHVEREVLDGFCAGMHYVTALHPRGTGYSGGTRGDIPVFARFIDDFVKVYSHERGSARTVVLVGHSMASAVAMAIAERMPDVDGIILVNPPFRMKASEGMTPGMREYLRYALFYLFARHTPVVNMAGDPSLIRNELDRREAELRANDPLLVSTFSMHMMIEVQKLLKGMAASARRMRCPLLLVYGDADGLVDKTGCDELYAAWASPRKRYEIIVGGPHGRETILAAMPAILRWIEQL